MANAHRIALIPGDGIGIEVTNAAKLVWREAAAGLGIEVHETEFPWSCAYYKATGRMMPADGIEQLRSFSSVFLGAVGWPAEVPDAVSLHGLLLPIRKSFDLYVNMRPHRVLPGITSPIRRTDFDILCIRENSEGEYSGAGGRIHVGTPDEVAVETAIFTKRGVKRILRYGFEQARRRSGRLASVTKSNAQKHSMVFWDEVVEEVSADYPDVTMTRYHVDAIAARMIMEPETLDVVVASNLFGDILSDIGAAIQGGLGYAASANINPDMAGPSMFEPVHGSAPDISGRDLANPTAAIWSAAMMFDHLGEERLARNILEAVTQASSATAGQRLGCSAFTQVVLSKLRQC